MRHSAGVKRILCLPLLFAVCAWADEASDRLAIGRVLAALNEVPQRPGLFTADGDAASELERLREARPLRFQILTPVSASGGVTVTISHEPWGEATLNFPGMGPLPPMVIVHPRIVSRAIRFITPDVALADAAYVDEAGGAATPLLFVMKKEGDSWKIDSLRVLAPR